MRSNLSVGMPIDSWWCGRDACDAELILSHRAGRRYFSDLRERWSAASVRPHRIRDRHTANSADAFSRRG